MAAKKSPKIELGVESAYQELDHLGRRIVELRRLIQVSESGPVGNNQNSFLICNTAAGEVAFEVGFVIEAVPIAELSPVHSSPDWFLGILNLRGEAVPVIDLASRLTGSPQPIDLDSLIIILEIKERRIGAFVSRVKGVSNFEKKMWTEVDPELSHAPFLTGMVAINDNLISIIDPRSLAPHLEISGEDE